MLPDTFTVFARTFTPEHPLEVVFTKAIEGVNNYPEEGMRATLTNIKISPVGGDDICVLTFNFKHYREFNKPLESPDYRLKVSILGQLYGTATEAGMYNDVDVVTVNPESNPNEYFTLFKDKLYEGYLKDRTSNESYLEWLERKVIESKILDKKTNK